MSHEALCDGEKLSIGLRLGTGCVNLQPLVSLLEDDHMMSGGVIGAGGSHAASFEQLVQLINLVLRHPMRMNTRPDELILTVPPYGNVKSINLGNICRMAFTFLLDSCSPRDAHVGLHPPEGKRGVPLDANSYQCDGR